MGNKENKMFCLQCQETAGCSGCTVSGVCGKKPDVAAMQDLLVYVTKGLWNPSLGFSNYRLYPEVFYLQIVMMKFYHYQVL